MNTPASSSAAAQLAVAQLFPAGTAVRYYGGFTDEIDRRIALNAEGADEAEAAWQREQAALG
jgi:hypothetical protein